MSYYQPITSRRQGRRFQTRLNNRDVYVQEVVLSFVPKSSKIEKWLKIFQNRCKIQHPTIFASFSCLHQALSFWSSMGNCMTRRARRLSGVLLRLWPRTQSQILFCCKMMVGFELDSLRIISWFVVRNRCHNTPVLLYFLDLCWSQLQHTN